MFRKFLAMSAALMLLTGCSNPLENTSSEEPETTTAPPTTTQLITEPPTLPKSMIYFRMGEDESAEPFLTSDHIVDCSMEILPSDSGESTYVVDIFFDDEGKEIFAKATQEAVDNGSMISTWYNQHLISVASVDEVIDEGAAVIAVTDMREASKIAGWIYECIEKPEDNNSNEGE